MDTKEELRESRYWEQFSQATINKMEEEREEARFLAMVTPAYNILWAVHEAGDVNTEQDARLLRMLNYIDTELGR